MNYYPLKNIYNSKMIASSILEYAYLWSHGWEIRFEVTISG